MLQTITIVKAFCDGFLHPTHTLKRCHHEDKMLRDNLGEEQVDHMVENTFPASDPPSTY